MVAATKNFQTFPVRSCSLPFVIRHLLFFLDTIWPQERPRHLFCRSNRDPHSNHLRWTPRCEVRNRQNAKYLHFLKLQLPKKIKGFYTPYHRVHVPSCFFGHILVTWTLESCWRHNASPQPTKPELAFGETRF